MSDNVRRSLRANKGLPPNRFTPYNASSRPTHQAAIMHPSPIRDNRPPQGDPSGAIVPLPPATQQQPECPDWNDMMLDDEMQPPNRYQQASPMQEDATGSRASSSLDASQLQENAPSPTGCHAEPPQQLVSSHFVNAPPPPTQTDGNMGRVDGQLPQTSSSQPFCSQSNAGGQSYEPVSAFEPPQQFVPSNFVRVPPPPTQTDGNMGRVDGQLPQTSSTQPFCSQSNAGGQSYEPVSAFEPPQQFVPSNFVGVPPPPTQTDQITGRVDGLLLHTSSTSDTIVAQYQERIRVLEREARQYHQSLNVMRLRNDSLERASVRPSATGSDMPQTTGFKGYSQRTPQIDCAPSNPRLSAFNAGRSWPVTATDPQGGALPPNATSRATPTTAASAPCATAADSRVGGAPNGYHGASADQHSRSSNNHHQFYAAHMQPSAEAYTTLVHQQPFAHAPRPFQVPNAQPPIPQYVRYVPYMSYVPYTQMPHVQQPHRPASFARPIPAPFGMQSIAATAPPIADYYVNAYRNASTSNGGLTRPAIGGGDTSHVSALRYAQNGHPTASLQRDMVGIALQTPQPYLEPKQQSGTDLPTRRARTPVEPTSSWPAADQHHPPGRPDIAEHLRSEHQRQLRPKSQLPVDRPGYLGAEPQMPYRPPMQCDEAPQMTYDQLHSQPADPEPCRDYRYQPALAAEHRAPHAVATDQRSTTHKRIIDLPAFGGRPEEWPKFICAFYETTREHAYTDLDNMTRLEKALVGAAKARVQHVLICPQHVAQTIETLAKAFGRPQMLCDSQLAEIRRFPKIGENRLDQLSSFSLVVDGFVSFLDAPETADYLDNQLVLTELTTKLPTGERRIWAGIARHLGHKPSVRDFARWLSESAEDIANIQSTMLDDIPPPRPRDERPVSKGRHVLLNVSERTSHRGHANCSFCGESHTIDDCFAFQNLAPRVRLLEVRKRPLCYMCLAGDHLLPGCRLNKVCGIDGCDRRHHQLLHDPSDQGARAPQPGQNDHPPAQPRLSSNLEVQSRKPKEGRKHQKQKSAMNTPVRQQDVDASEPRAVVCCQMGRPEQVLYYRIVPVILYGQAKQLTIYALLDEGSSVSLLDADVAKELQLEGEDRSLDLQFVSGESSTQQSRKVRLGISGAHAGAKRFEIDAVNTTTKLSLPVQTVDRKAVVKKNPHLADVPFASFENVRPKLLLGLEHHFLGVPVETRTGVYERSVVAGRSQLGWIIYGCCGSSPTSAVIQHASESRAGSEPDAERLNQLHELVRDHFTTENFGVKTSTAMIQSDADKRASRILVETTRRVGERFETGLLWKQDQVTLPDSYPMALQRLTSVEAKMRRNPGYAKQYLEQIASYVEKGYARKLTPAEAAHRGPRTWYLPHFAVQNPSKPGKFRLVFDAAASTHGVCLNDMLLSGPDLNVPLTRLLFRFRLGVVGVCADVKEMFLRVLVREADRDAQRFLWRDGDGRAEPDVYIMRAMTFGSTCSPTSAQYVKNVNAEEFKDRYPDAAEAVRSNHYVDDYVASFRSSEEAQRITSQVIDIHRHGGFELRGVISNCPAVRARFGADADVNRSFSLEPEDASQKILGMTWQTSGDTFGFQTRFHRVDTHVMDGSRKPTKREVLSVAMSIFDPFGFLADFLLPTKSILQELWRLGTQWDEQVPDAINKRWQAWRMEVDKTRRVCIARCYSPSIGVAPTQLHVFADASEEAFAAVAYWRIEGESGVQLAFVAAKVRCAPMKILSIPRLELQAAVLATRLALEIRQSHPEVNVSRTTFWTDSETVLKWLRCDQRRYVPFVAHRVAEVVESAPAELWRWVPTAQNVADDATRVKTPITFDHESRWLHGPSWLKSDAESWPVQRRPAEETEEAPEELRPKYVGVISQRGAVDFGKFSKLTRLTRCLGWIRRFSWNARNPDSRRNGELTASEVDQATEEACRLVQAEVYADDIAKLRSGQALSSDRDLFVLKPYLDENGTLRLHGRTDLAKEEFLSSSAKRPIIMPSDHHVSMLLVRHYHQYMAHQLTEATMTAVRTKFWIPKLRSLVRSVQAACQLCRVRAAKPIPPMQGQLPSDRLTAFARPFTTTGLDYFGPYHVTVGRRREKRWVALFTCMAVRAVHLEVAADLSTDACLVCLRNFCNLRGIPATIRCDNGTNFVGASNELGRERTFFDPVAIQQELSVKGIEWKFNCPNNPEAGGAWERLVQTVKRVLNVTMDEQAPRVETFRALLLEAANIVNARPLTHVQVDPEDPEPLTPNHLLLGGPNVATVPNPSDVEPAGTRRQWQICRGLSRRFWTQFVHDYLPELTRRSRHYPDQPPLQIGDCVFMCDNQRSSWTRGRITAVEHSKDGAVRRATVRTASGEYQRPVARLARIDVGPPGGVGGRGAVLKTVE